MRRRERRAYSRLNGLASNRRARDPALSRASEEPVLRASVPKVAAALPTLTLQQLQSATVAVPLAFFGSYCCLKLGPARFARCRRNTSRLLEATRHTNERLVALYQLKLAL